MYAVLEKAHMERVTFSSCQELGLRKDRKMWLGPCGAAARCHGVCVTKGYSNVNLRWASVSVGLLISTDVLFWSLGLVMGETEFPGYLLTTEFFWEWKSLG